MADYESAQSYSTNWNDEEVKAWVKQAQQTFDDPALTSAPGTRTEAMGPDSHRAACHFAWRAATPTDGALLSTGPADAPADRDMREEP